MTKNLHKQGEQKSSQSALFRKLEPTNRGAFYEWTSRLTEFRSPLRVFVLRTRTFDSLASAEVGI
jgi:hypothetical protein